MLHLVAFALVDAVTHKGLCYAVQSTQQMHTYSPRADLVKCSIVYWGQRFISGLSTHMGESGKVYTAVCVCYWAVVWEWGGSVVGVIILCVTLEEKTKVWETKTERYRELCVYVWSNLLVKGWQEFIAINVV